jgi:hypothetical protein
MNVVNRLTQLYMLGSVLSHYYCGETCYAVVLLLAMECYAPLFRFKKGPFFVRH